MQIIFKHERNERKNSDDCHLIEYPLREANLDFAIVTINGRYPDAPQQATNLISKEMVYIHEGTGKIVVNGREQLLQPGDLVLIEPGEKFYWQGNMVCFISCRPAFTLDQHRWVNEVDE